MKELPRHVDRLADLLELVEFEREAIRQAQEPWKNNADFIEFMEKRERTLKMRWRKSRTSSWRAAAASTT